MRRQNSYCIFCDGVCECGPKKKAPAKKKSEAKPKPKPEPTEEKPVEETVQSPPEEAPIFGKSKSAAKQGAVFAAMKAAAKKASDERKAKVPKIQKRDSDFSFADAIRVLAPLLHETEKEKWAPVLEQDVTDLEERRQEWRRRTATS